MEEACFASGQVCFVMEQACPAAGHAYKGVSHGVFADACIGQTGGKMKELLKNVEKHATSAGDGRRLSGIHIDYG